MAISSRTAAAIVLLQLSYSTAIAGDRDRNGDPLPYGVDPNRAALEELVGHTLRQGILTRPPELQSLFAEI